MDRTLNAVLKMLDAVDAPKYDLGVLSDRGMLPVLSDLSRDQVISRLPLLKSYNARGAHIYVRPSGEHRFTVLDDLGQDPLDRMSGDGYEPCAVLETSPGNFQAWLKHDNINPTRLSTFIATNLAERYQGDLNAADWRRLGVLPVSRTASQSTEGPHGLFPFVLLQNATGQPYSRAAILRLEMTKQYQLREQERERRIAEFRQAALSDPNRNRFSHLSLERFRLSPKYAGRPASADIALCVAAYSLGMTENDMASTLATDYLSRDPNPRRKAAYIERTLVKARAWAQR